MVWEKMLPRPRLHLFVVENRANFHFWYKPSSRTTLPYLELNALRKVLNLSRHRG